MSNLEGQSQEALSNEIHRLRAALHKLEHEAQLRARRRSRIGFFVSKASLRTFAGSQLFRKTVDLWDAWSTWVRSGGGGPWPESPTRDFAAALLARFTRVGLTFVILASLPLIITLLQLIALTRQTELIDRQTELAESARRSALIFEQTAILDKIDEEMGSLTVADSGKPRLSLRLEGRIIALSRSLRPYRYLDGNKLTPIALSPERGQLLTALMNSQIDMSHVLTQANFQYSDLPGIRFRDFDLGQKMMVVSKMTVLADSTIILRADEISLAGSNFRSSLLEDGSFKLVRFEGADFRNASLNSVNFEEAKLTGASFSYATLIGVNFTDANLQHAVFEGARMINTTINLGRHNEVRTLGARLCRASSIESSLISAVLLTEMATDSECAQKLRNNVAQTEP
ncbi:MAG TPA: pentapeptide repeat-containing protein [Longimicrobium sp.]|uniref:pentapeptide repeat-containing protein n=1 Tax=Longimicrobium sp. TaxID=2029185 RepID=UPI002ED9D96D